LVALAFSPLTQGSLVYSGSGNADTGFGGAVGNGSLVLEFDGISTVTGTITRGTSGDFNDALVIYLDTVAGGAGDTSAFTDNGDDLRRAISGFDGGSNRSTLSFGGGFGADYAIAIGPNGPNFGGIWALDNTSNFTFADTVNLTPTGTGTAASYTFDFDISAIGLALNETAVFVTTYTSVTGFRSTESIGNDVSGTQGYNAFTSGTAQSFTAVPEAAEASLVALGALGLLTARRRRRSAA
jgi:MYXO-CTERM domain-containing protein